MFCSGPTHPLCSSLLSGCSSVYSPKSSYWSLNVDCASQWTSSSSGPCDLIAITRVVVPFTCSSLYLTSELLTAALHLQASSRVQKAALTSAGACTAKRLSLSLPGFLLQLNSSFTLKATSPQGRLIIISHTDLSLVSSALNTAPEIHPPVHFHCHSSWPCDKLAFSRQARLWLLPVCS